MEHWAHFLILYYPHVNTQITGVGNRTTIADGNTWNHEHLALLGKCLVSEEEKSYKITRHLADYVLVWSTRYAGMYGDDLAKVRSKVSRRSCTCEYRLQSCRGKPAGVAIRPRERSPTRNPTRHDSRLLIQFERDRCNGNPGDAYRAHRRERV